MRSSMNWHDSLRIPLVVFAQNETILYGSVNWKLHVIRNFSQNVIETW